MVSPLELRGDGVILAGDDLHDPVDTMLAVAWIDPFRRVAEEEMLTPDKARNLRQQGKRAEQYGPCRTGTPLHE